MPQLTEKDVKGMLDEIITPLVGSTIDERMKKFEAEQKTAMEARFKSFGDRQDAPEKLEKGMLLAQMIGCVTRSKLAFRDGVLKSPVDIATKEFGVGAQVTKALAASIGQDGGLLIADQLASEMIEFLRPISAVRKLNPVVLPMDAGKLDIPKIVAGAIASYQGENQNAGKTQETFGNVKLSAKKLTALTPVSNDLVRRMSVGNTQMIRDDIAAAIAQRSDLAFIRDDGTAGTVKGMRNQAASANVLNATASPTLATTVTDLGRLYTALAAANVRFLRPGWIMAPRTFNYLNSLLSANGVFVFRDELSRGTLNGYPFAVTSQIPTNLNTGVGNESELYLADFADVVIGETTNLLLDVSTEAAYWDGSQVVAAFSQDQSVVRAIIEHDLGVRHAESIAVLAQVIWT